MKEVTFIRQNIEKWRDVELIVEHSINAAPDRQADAYIDLTTDLAFAQTHYPKSRITLYLNNLASALHNLIYRNKRERLSRLVTFWTQEIPQTIYEARRALLASFLIFAVFVVIGAVSQWGDDSFCRLILGDQYVDMTLRNIVNGEPMAVYNGDGETQMFLGITFNNIKVSFFVFVAGVLTSLGTGFFLLQNGIMLGSFQTFFFQQGVGFESMLAIWLHGTLEIWAVIVAGAAGITLGNGWLMPGTYGRLTSFMRAARRGLKIIVGTVPIFIMAGFIESFATRHTEWGTWPRLAIIGCSALFIVYYYLYLPYHRNHANTQRKD